MKTIIRFLLYFSVFVAPMGAQAFCISTPIGELSLFRISLIFAFIFDMISNKFIIYLPMKPHNKASLLLLVFIFIYSIISGIWAKDSSSWFKYVFFMAVALIICYLINSYFNSIKDIQQSLRIFSIGIFLQDIIGWLEVFSGNYLFRSVTEHDLHAYMAGEFHMPIAMQFNPNNFSLLIFVGVFISFCCYMFSKKKIVRLFYLFVSVSEVALLILSQSRSCIIAFLLGIALLLFLYDKKKYIKYIAVLIVLFYIPSFFSKMGEILKVDINSTSGSDYIRVNVIKNGFVFLSDTFGIGIGAGQIPYWLKKYSKFPTEGIYMMHNFWIEFLVTYGIIIFFCFILFYSRLFFDFYQYCRKIHNSDLKTISLLFCCILFGFIVGAVGPSSAFTLEWLWTYFAICITTQAVIEGDMINEQYSVNN